MDSSKTTWGIGDYPQMAERLEPVAVVAIAAAGISPGDRVVDIATGTGNAALLASERGGQVVGVDFEPALLRFAERRARVARREVSWLLGDMQRLPLRDDTTDVVVSVFGVMYATDQAAAANELARVAAPGSRIVLASWVPGSLMPEMGKVLSSYLPAPPPSSAPPSRWGDPSALQRMLAESGVRLTATSLRRLVLTFPDAPAAEKLLLRSAGHILRERQRLIGEGRWEAMCHDLLNFIEHRADRIGDQLNLVMDYLVATASAP
ncbi:MAG: class I SAM-dependent methyltransferase [Mycobacteriales bacterium]